MKRIRLTATLLGLVLGATGLAAASPSRLEGRNVEQCKPVDQRFALPVAEPQRSPGNRISATDLSGKYFIQWDDLGGNSPRQGYDASTRITFRNDSAFIENFFGLDFTAKGKYDAATQTISIAPQFAFTESPYGDFWLCPFDSQRGGFYSDPSAHIDLTITPEGNLKSGTLGWVVVIKDPAATFYGSALGMSRNLQYKLTNATMSGNQRDIKTKQFAPVTYRVYVEQVAPTDLLIANIATNGREVHALLKPGYKWEMEPQVLVESVTVGPSCNYPATWTSSQNKGTNANMTGEGDVATLDFGPWGVFRANALLQCAFGMESSLLELDAGKTITWPTESSNAFEGQGTKENPYKIASADDFVKLATRVNAGEKFTGNYFIQTADVDFSTLKGTYYPIGNSKTNLFDGDFNGNGKSISKLVINRGSNQYTGLFGNVGANGYLHDVNITGSRITASGKYNGLLVGYCLGKINNVKTNGYLKSTTENNGGVAGYSCAIRNSSFVGQLIGMAYTGGITGELHWDTVANCHVSAAISSSIPNTIGHAVGGVVGSAIGASSSGKAFVSDCYFLGSLADNTGYAHTGGIIGSLGNNASACRNMAVGVMTTSVTKSSIGSGGGIVGYLSGGAIYDCYSSVAIQDPSENTKVGGLVGQISVSKFITPEVRNCITTGQVRIAGIAAPAQAVYGSKEANAVLTNTFADTQTTGIDHGENGKYTRELAVAQPLEGFDANIWQFQEGRYPIIKNVMPANAAALASVPAFLAGDEKITNVKNDITLTLDPAIKWALYNSNSQYVQETEGIKIENGKAKLKGVLSQEFLVASLESEELGGTFSRIYYLNVAPSQFEGEGTAENPYLIKTVNDLKTLNKAITQNGLTFEDDHFALVNDLDFTGVTDFFGVADDSKETHAFAATFDGRGHKIKNWKLKGLMLNAEGKVAQGSRQTVALFGIVGKKGVIKNLVIDSSCKFEGHSGIASTVAICYGKVENVRNYADVTAAKTHAAGIVARLAADDATVTNCYNAGTIVCGSTYAAGIVADMVGKSFATYCQNDGIVHTDSIVSDVKYSATACASGIVAVTNGAATVSYCVNQGDITCPAEGAGIIARAAAGTKIINSITTGQLNVTDKSSSFGAVVANRRTSEPFENVYYDSQINFQGAASNADWTGCIGLKTSEMLNGQALQGLGTDVFDYQNGKYPVLKAYVNESATTARRNMALILHPADALNEISNPATVTTGDGVKWSLKGEGFALNGNNLTLVNINKPGHATLTASLNGYTRSIEMQSAHVPFTGKGTEADPYRLNTFNDWMLLSQYTNTYGFRYEGKYFAMDNDVKFDSTVNYVPVAFNSAYLFEGNIDGRNHKLIDVKMTYTDKSLDSYENVAVIGMLGSKGVVRNINLYGKIYAYKYVGGLVAVSQGLVDNCHNYAEVGTSNNTNTGGLVCTASSGKITNCTNHGKVIGNYTVVGGIVSYIASSVEVRNCVNYGSVMAYDAANNRYYNTVGGIIGSGDGRLVGCVNRGEVKGSGTVGGVAGFISRIDSCINYSEIYIEGSMVGGVAGKVYKATNCYNYGKVSGNNYTGGVIGDVNSNGLVSYCSNHAPVHGMKQAYTGGVTGDLSSGAAMDSCANYAPITANGTNSGYVGGVTGGATNGSVKASRLVNYADVKVVGKNCYYVGGVAGAFGGDLTECYNLGNVSSESYGTGGISGYGSGKAYNCVNLGNVETTYDDASKKYGNAGGIWGTGGTGVFDCINYGNVSGQRYVGGIQGYPTGSTKIKRVYFNGELNTGDGATSSAIMHVDASQKNVTVDSAYYNSENIGDFLTNDADQARCIPLITKEMITAKLGDAFTYHEFALPTLKSFANVKDLNVAAAILFFKNDESAKSFRTSARVELFPGAVWSCTPNLKIAGNKICVVAAKANDPATITVKGDRFTKTFNVVTDNGGNYVDGIDGDKTVLSVRYFTIGGIEVQQPAQGTTVIERTLYTDGTSRTRKVIVR